MPRVCSRLAAPEWRCRASRPHRRAPASLPSRSWCMARRSGVHHPLPDGPVQRWCWRLRNLIIETINLGEIYRNQFSALARDADDDLDSVIAQWNEAVIEQAEELTGD